MVGKFVKEIASRVVGDDAASKVWSRLELIGDIAVIRKPPDLPLDILKPLAEEVLRRLPYVKSAWASTTPVSGAFRVRDYVHLAGEYRSTTMYKEHGCVFFIDITKVYISPTLSYEHIRVAKEVREGEFVINMFAGAGLFSVIIAKHSKPSKVVSIDINPYAYEFMVKNIKLNGVEDVVEPVLGDAGVVIERYLGMANRVLMPLPELAYQYFHKAINALRSEGVIHVYDFEFGHSKKEVIEKVSSKYISKARELKVNAEVVYGRVVRSVGPRKYQVVLDVKVIKE